MYSTTSLKMFADWFNVTYRGAHRNVSVEDIREMTECGLIGRYRYYSPSQDGEIIRGILQYEQMREKRTTQETTDDKEEPPKCIMCGKELVFKKTVKTGRPKQYCNECEPNRGLDRYRKWKHKNKS